LNKQYFSPKTTTNEENASFEVRLLRGLKVPLSAVFTDVNLTHTLLLHHPVIESIEILPSLKGRDENGGKNVHMER
jgi:hypothetical protein